MTSKVREHGLATNKHLIQIEEMFLALLDQDVSTSEELKNMIAGLEADKLKNGSLSSIFDAYATYFWPLFPSVPESAVQDINLASRLYVEHFTLLDHIIDADIESNFHPPLYLKSTFLLQQSLAILYRYFPQSSPFWDEFQHHQREFLHAFLLKKKLQDGKQEQLYDYTTFKCIAAGEIGMIKCTVAALAVLVDMPEKLKKLYSLFDKIAIFIHLHDDFVDWKKDFESKHYSYLLRQLFAEIGIQSEQQIHLLDEKVLKRRFFTSQTLQSAVDDMLSRLEHLLQAPEFAECKDWLRYLSQSYDSIKDLKSNLYSIALRCRQIRSLPKNMSFIDKALWFLTTSQTIEGAWSDFQVPEIGEQTAWMTGYVASALLQYPTTYHLLDHAANWLRQQQFPEGGWGWHHQAAMDADSTAACLSFMASQFSVAEAKQAIAALFLFQRADGGFSTWVQDQTKDLAAALDVDENTNFSGLCMSHNCVTAAGVIALCLARKSHQQLELTYGSALASAVQYLLLQQQMDGRWHSYWYHGNIYATALSIRALQMASRYSEKKQQIQEAQQRGRAFLLQMQLPNGGWGGYPSSECCPFQTSLALQAFGGCSEAEYQSAISAACCYLEQSQQANGCWRASTPLMRAPRPDDTHPWDWPENIQSGYESGAGVVIPDNRHIFTTATVLRALPLFYEFVRAKEEKTLQEEAIG